MKILLTNYQLKEFSGSEIDTLEIANYFVNNGHSVDIFTLDIGLPLAATIDPKIHIFDFNKNKLLFNHYDLIWSHHFPLLDYILFNRGITADYIHYVCLSTIEPLEFPPNYYKELTLVSTLSENAKLKLKTEGVDIDSINIFPNYAKISFFDYNNNVNKEIKAIAVVSNHIPEELLEAVKILEETYTVDIYGKGYKYTQINEKVLSKYDVIISIGKTINYSLAMGIPSYCYDHWGGPGYIRLDNIESNIKDSFNGKTVPLNKKTDTIVHEIINSYTDVLKEIKQLKQFSIDNFCLEVNINKTLNLLKKSPKMDYISLYQKYEREKKVAGLFVNTVARKNNDYYAVCPNIVSFCKLYLDRGRGFNELDTIQVYYKEVSANVYESVFNIENYLSSIEKIRVDFLDKQLVNVEEVMINDVTVPISSMHDMIMIRDQMFTFSDDPWIIIEKDSIPNSQIKVTLKLSTKPNICIQDIIMYALECEERCNLNDLELKKVINSKSWKITKPLRFISKYTKSE